MKVVAVCLVALCAASCSPSGSPPAGGAVGPEPSAPPAAQAAPSGMTVEEARALASGYSFLRPAASDSYEVLYFDPGGKASLLRGELLQIVHGRWSAEMAPVGSSPTPVAAICLTLGANRRCLDPTLLSAANTERQKGDVLGIGTWTTVPESLPRERAPLAELRDRIRS
ncbi:hypothetical protein [Enterovirga sp.]|uniref:hypothetical protein n=1 Tax=Enterovirga sp. TaxID=2026350 RepID=UPI002D18FE0B|nr:hypothetical protein [Enterovirga sp.]HMO30415.1 hypothetical protein [Enterovirga sp.]